MKICETCEGSGQYKSGCHSVTCPECHGNGQVPDRSTRQPKPKQGGRWQDAEWRIEHDHSLDY